MGLCHFDTHFKLFIVLLFLLKNLGKNLGKNGNSIAQIISKTVNLKKKMLVYLARGQFPSVNRG